MKNLLLLFALILSLNSFAQELEDDSNELFYLMDSIYIKYNITKTYITTKTYYDEEVIADMLSEGTSIRIATDEELSTLLSDSISTLYHATKEFSRKKQLNTIYNFIGDMAIDSNLNVLYVRVTAPCQPCMNSILDNITSDEEITQMLSDGKVKHVYVNYYQTIRNVRYEFIDITVKHRFKRKQIYTLYNEKL